MLFQYHVWIDFFFQAEDGIRDHCVTGVQTCALQISVHNFLPSEGIQGLARLNPESPHLGGSCVQRSEEHTSELQSHSDLVCRLLLEKKNQSTHDTETTSIENSLTPTLRPMTPCRE